MPFSVKGNDKVGNGTKAKVCHGWHGAGVIELRAPSLITIAFSNKRTLPCAN